MRTKCKRVTDQEIERSAEKITELRDAVGSNHALADLLYCDHTNISGWAIGRQPVNLQSVFTIIQIARRFNVDIEPSDLRPDVFPAEVRIFVPKKPTLKPRNLRFSQ